MTAESIEKAGCPVGETTLQVSKEFSPEVMGHRLGSLDMEVKIPKRSLWWRKSQETQSKGLDWAFPVERRLTTDASSWGWGPMRKT